MPEGGRLVIETGNAHLDRAYTRQNAGVNEGAYVCVSVSDTGTGMSPEIAARAFDRSSPPSPSARAPASACR